MCICMNVHAYVTNLRTRHAGYVFDFDENPDMCMYMTTPYARIGMS